MLLAGSESARAESAAQVRTGNLVSNQCQVVAGAMIRGPTLRRELALVFTAHEFGEGGEVILDALQRARVKASFFLTGTFLRNAEFAPFVGRMVQDGHYAGPHSDAHLLYLSWETPPRRLVTQAGFSADLEANLRELKAGGIDRRTALYFLPPYEHADATIAAWTREAGLRLVNYTPGTLTHGDYTGEADANFFSSERIWRSIVEREKTDPHGLNGWILLMHLGAGPRRADKFHARLPELLAWLDQRGYKPVRIDALLDACGPSPSSPR
jgi:peptidoglycan/xylan/chitin deacetylase (PgdA/CDA1 family)